MRRTAAVLTCLAIIGWAAAPLVVAQSGQQAEANQLHAAIVNGDVDSLRYWLTDRHADVSAANSSEPDVTPLARCVGLAARTLDAPPASEREAREISPPVVSLRTLQTMVTLLHQYGARLTDADRRQFSGPALRWYDDTVSTPAGRSGKPAVALGLATVVLRTNPRESCNGTGHAVYVVNQTQLSVNVRVTMYEDAAGTAAGSPKSDSYSVDPDSSWRLGCDAGIDGRGVRYVLNGWR